MSFKKMGIYFLLRRVGKSGKDGSRDALRNYMGPKRMRSSLPGTLKLLSEIYLRESQLENQGDYKD